MINSIKVVSREQRQNIIKDFVLSEIEEMIDIDADRLEFKPFHIVRYAEDNGIRCDESWFDDEIITTVLRNMGLIYRLTGLFYVAKWGDGFGK